MGTQQPEDLARLLHTAKRAAVVGAEAVLGSSAVVVKEHGGSDVTTEADETSEKTIIGYLREEFPDDGILAEEGGLHQESQSGRTWVVDPLDGTDNALNGLPSAVSVSCVDKNGYPLVAAVYVLPAIEDIDDPHTMIFTALGCGVFMDKYFYSEANSSIEKLEKPPRSLPLRAKQNELGKISVGLASPYHGSEEVYQKEFNKQLEGSGRQLGTGCVVWDMCKVAIGSFGVFYHKGMKPWDIAAAILILLGTGHDCVTTDTDMNKFEGGIAEEITAYIRGEGVSSAEFGFVTAKREVIKQFASNVCNADAIAHGALEGKSKKPKIGSGKPFSVKTDNKGLLPKPKDSLVIS